jgi:Xaa-Pro aminopeptidase
MSLIKEKVEQAKAILDELDIDCWVTFVRESQINGDPALAFLIEADVTWHSAFIISRNGETVAIVGLYDKKSVEDVGAWDTVEGYIEGVKTPLQSTLRRLDPKTIAVNYSEGSEICDGITHGMFLTLSKMLAEIGFDDRIVSAEKVVSALRERKSSTELEHMRGAIRATEEIFDQVAGFIRPGVSEQEIAAFMKSKVAAAGLELAWEETVCPAVFTGPETAGAHYAPSERKVERGHILNMDFGVKVGGYCSDMQRTFYILNEGESSAPPEVQSGFDTIVKAIEQSRQAMRPGVEGRAIDAVARGLITGAAYDEFPHALGHQVGRYSHDGTAILGPEWEKYAQKPFLPLEEAMVFTIEPRLTVPNRGVATIEEMVVVIRDGAEFLSNPQTQLLLIT